MQINSVELETEIPHDVSTDKINALHSNPSDSTIVLSSYS